MSLGQLAALLATLASLIVVDPASGAPRSLHFGFLDDSVSFDPDPASRTLWHQRIAGAGADRIRVNVTWSSIAKRAPAPGEDPSDPGWSGYSWGSLDAAVNQALAHGLQPIMTFGRAPSWAEGPNRSRHARAGTWRPDPAELAAFSKAAARRYPTVRYWQAWNEPNLDIYLSPLWRRGRPAAPGHYRRMLNAFYGAVKSVNAANLVISAGTAPYGDAGPKGERIRPVLFVRELLCLRGRALKRAPCPAPAKFDVLAHHPYSVGGPRRRALNENDVSVPDLAKLVKPLRRAERTGRALPRKRHRVWVTEMSWDSSPPDPEGVPAERHARWLEEAFYILWREGVDTMIWLLARDQAPTPSFAFTYQSGIFLRDGTPKPAATAFAFPFVGIPVASGRVRLWGKAPAAGTISVERRTPTGWASIAKFQGARAGEVFTRVVRLRRRVTLRAVAGARTSLVWSVR